jgi:hypothetical protein
MPKKSSPLKIYYLRKNEFDGVMPLEIMIDTKKPKGAMKSVTLKELINFKKKLKT